VPTNTSTALIVALLASLLIIVVALRLFAQQLTLRRTAETELQAIRGTLAQRIQAQVTTLESDNVRLAEQTRQAEQLQTVAVALAEAVTATEVIDIVVKQGVNTVGAVGGALTNLVNDRTQLKIIGAAGYPQSVIEQWEVVPMSRPTLMTAAIEGNEPLWIRSQAEALLSHPELINSDPTHNAWAALPLSVNSRVFGALGLTFATEQIFDKTEQGFIVALAQKCAQALERIRLLGEIRTEREQFQFTLLSIGEAVISADTQGRITFINQAAQTLTGWAADKALGTDLAQVARITDETPGERPARVMDASNASRFPTGRTMLRCADGRVIPVMVTSSQIHSEQGIVTGTVLVLHDMTETRRQEATLEESLQRTQDLYETCQQIGLVNQPADVLRAQFSSRDLKQAWQACFITFDSNWDESLPTTFLVTAILQTDKPLPGLADDHTLAASPLFSLFSPQSPVFIDEVETDKRVGETLRAIFRDRAVHSVIIYPLTSHSRTPKHIFGLMVAYFTSPMSWQPADRRHLSAIAEQAMVALENAHLLAEEHRARAEAEEANATRLKFLAMISHELRTPLTSIKGFASTLRATDVDWEPSQQAEFIAIIDEEANKLSVLIDQLLDMSRLQAGALSIHLEPRRLDDLLAAMHTQLKEITSQHYLIIDKGDDLPFVQIDPKRIAQVFINLIDNAAKYAPPGTSIKISFLEQPTQVQVNVSDEGPGIPPEDRERVFAAFAHIDRTVRQANKGVGLGLAITKGVVEAHGGSIWVLDSDQPGATLAFTLRTAAPSMMAYA